MTHLESDPEFLKTEVSQLIAWCQAGESASIVGVSGVGKSNLFHQLLHPQIQAAHLAGEATPTLFARVDFHSLIDFTSRSLYSLVLEQLEDLDGSEVLSTEAASLICEHHEAMLSAGADALRVQYHFKRAMHVLFRPTARRLILLFDQFDDVYREAEPRVLANLRGLREAYKYRLAYWVFTRDRLATLAPTDPDRQEFYELFRSNEMWLRPYGLVDTRIAVNRIGRRYRVEISPLVTTQLYRLTGGHAGLLSAAVKSLANREVNLLPDDQSATEQLMTLPSIEVECQQIWQSLSVTEQRVLLQRVYGPPALEASTVVALLQNKGLLTQPEAQFFSPLWAAYVRRQQAQWDRPLHLDHALHKVWVLDMPRELTTLEYRLAQVLFAQMGQLVSKDKLITAGWPEALGGVTDETLTTAMSRLRRKIEPDPEAADPRYLKTIRGEGYLLQLEPPVV